MRYPPDFTSTVGGDEVLEYVQTFTEVAVIGVSMMEPSGFAIRPRIQQADESVPQNHAHRSRPSCRAVEGNLLLFLTVTVNHGFSFRLSIIALDTRSFAAAQISIICCSVRPQLPDQTGTAPEFQNFCFCLGDDFVFLLRDDHVMIPTDAPERAA